jgi:hypothetical protein
MAATIAVRETVEKCCRLAYLQANLAVDFAPQRERITHRVLCRFYRFSGI